MEWKGGEQEKTEKRNERKIWFFANINKNDKLLERLINKKREDTDYQISRMKDSIMRKCYEHKYNNLKDQFFENHKLPNVI